MIRMVCEIVFQDRRPHLDGRGIHCGEVIEVLLPDRTWQAVRVELEHPDTWVFLSDAVSGELKWGQPARWPIR